MNIFQAQRLAKYNDDHLDFLADFPNGTFLVKWIDAHLGLLTIPAVFDGFMKIQDIDDQYPELQCRTIKKVSP